MTKALPPLTWFRAFDAAARHLSFTAAAAELGMTQSAISQNIRALETRFGSPLFVRKSRGLVLTDEGRRLVPDVAAAMARLTRAAQSFEPSNAADVLTVATSVSIAQWLIVPAMADLARKNPALRLRFVTTVWPDDFLALQADVEIRFGTRDVAGQDAQPLGPGDLVPVASPALISAWPALRGGNWAGLTDLPLIQPVGVTPTWADYLRRLGQKSGNMTRYFVDSHGLAVDLAVQSAGVALTSTLIAAPAIADGRLVALSGPRIVSDEGYFYATNGGVAAERFVAWLMGIIGTTPTAPGQVAED